MGKAGLDRLNAIAADPSQFGVTSAYVRQVLQERADLMAALKALEYHDEPGRFCDHAAEPCQCCELARATLAKAEREGA